MCLPLMFASCGNIDNPLEEITVSGGATSYASLAAAMNDIDDGAEVEVAYTVYGSKDEYKVKIKKVNGAFVPQGTAGLPTGLDYKLSGIIEQDGTKLIFKLHAKPTDEWVEEWENPVLVGSRTRGDVPEDPEINGEYVMVITFDIQTSEYDVINAPGFSFKVLNVKGLPVNVENACSKTATVIMTYDENKTISWTFNHNGESWLAFAEKYEGLDDGDESDNSYNIIYEDIYDENGSIYFDFDDYPFVYGNSPWSIIYTDEDCENKVDPESEIEDKTTYYARRTGGEE